MQKWLDEARHIEAYIRLCYGSLAFPADPCPRRAMNHRPEFMQLAQQRLICCLLALEISDYEAKPIFDQIGLTQAFHELVSDATAGVPPHELISAVGEEGGLLAFCCEPADCLTAALAIRDATLTQERYRDLQVRIGIDLGKAHIAEDALGQPQVSGEARQDADRLMRQGPPGQVSVSRRFVELLSRSAPELAESLEYRGTYSDDIGPPLYWYRAPAPADRGLETAFDEQRSAWSWDSSYALIQSKLAPIAIAVRSMAKRRLLRPSLGYALLLLVVGSAIVALSVRLSVNPPASNPTTPVGVVTPPTPRKAPEASPAPAQSFIELIASSPAPALPEETVGPQCHDAAGSYQRFTRATGCLIITPLSVDRERSSS
jgi:hypothetical protein